MLTLTFRVHQDREVGGKLRMDIEAPAQPGTPLEIAALDRVGEAVKNAIRAFAAENEARGVADSYREAEGANARGLRGEMLDAVGAPKAINAGKN